MDFDDEMIFTCRVPMNSARTWFQSPLTSSSSKRTNSIKYIDGSEFFGSVSRSNDRFPKKKRTKKSFSSTFERKWVRTSRVQLPQSLFSPSARHRSFDEFNSIRRILVRSATDSLEVRVRRRSAVEIAVDPTLQIDSSVSTFERSASRSPVQRTLQLF